MADLSGSQFLDAVLAKDADSGRLFQKIINAVNSLGRSVGAAPVGTLSAPPPIDGISVKGTQSGNVITCPNELLHFVLTHNVPLRKGVQYISEIDTSPDFTQPHVIDHGCSRTHTMTLPTFLDDGITPQVYYLRSYPQHIGSAPQRPTVLGGLTGATQIKMSGTTAATLLPSTGSGTASGTGQQGGSGLGKVLNRPASGAPKRNIGTA